MLSFEKYNNSLPLHEMIRPCCKTASTYPSALNDFAFVPHIFLPGKPQPKADKQQLDNDALQSPEFEPGRLWQ